MKQKKIYDHWNYHPCFGCYSRLVYTMAMDKHGVETECIGVEREYKYI